MMKMQNQNSKHGFTLLELMVSMALGLIVMASMASLFKTGMNTTMLVQQRAETQENMRAAIDIMVKDISLAGAGLPTGGIQLPLGGTGSSKFSCDQSSTCYVPNYTYPSGNFMYGIIPGYLNGVQGNAVIAAAPAPAVNDSITVIYVDYNFPLWEYNTYFVAGSNGANVTLTANPNYSANPPPSITSAGAINAGDLIMISGGGVTAVGEVTNLSASGTTAGSPGAMTFANSDPLNVNQTGATSGNLKQVQSAAGAGTAVTAYRLYCVTYYLSVPGGSQTTRLMRQVNGQSPAPVADDIINLQFAYDVYNSSVTPTVLDPNQPNPIGNAESPNNIQKVNISLIGQSINNMGNKSQNMSLATSVSAGNLTFRSQQQYQQ
jgi:prepilin-type N-terminal cleavage/methylation domain-containing protein